MIHNLLLGCIFSYTWFSIVVILKFDGGGVNYAESVSQHNSSLQVNRATVFYENDIVKYSSCLTILYMLTLPHVVAGAKCALETL